MADERHEYEALTPIPDPINPGRMAYLPGQPLHAQVVADLGLQVGEQVKSLRPAEMARPAGNAGRDEWLRYRAAQPDADQAALAEMSRDQLRDLDDESGNAPPARAGRGTKAKAKAEDQTADKPDSEE